MELRRELLTAEMIEPGTGELVPDDHRGAR